MTPLALAGLAVIAIVVFLFVIEPILRAKSDQVVLDAAALPLPAEPSDLDDDDLVAGAEIGSTEQNTVTPHESPAVAARRVSSDLV